MSSRTDRVDCSVPQGSCLVPVELITNMESVASVFGRHNINHHLFADEQAYASTPLEGVDDVHGRLRDCTTDISNWCASCRLQLKENNTEHTWFSKRSRLNKLAKMEQTVTVGASVIQPAAAVRDLGVLPDQELSMTQHIVKVTSSCFYQLRRLPSDTSFCQTGTRSSAGPLVRSSVNVLFLSLDRSHGMTFLVYYILLLLRTPSV